MLLFYHVMIEIPIFFTGIVVLTMLYFIQSIYHSGVKKVHYNESSENYLETILVLSQRLPVVRSVDVANELGFKKSSVSIAMKNLREKEHIIVSDAGFISLTPSGKAIADMIYERHETLRKVLIALGVNEETAAEDACRIEHVISPESFDAIKKHIAAMER